MSFPSILVAVLAIMLIALVLFEVFETIVLPRRVARQLRLTRLLYLTTYPLFVRLSRKIQRPQRRETLLAYFGPLVLIMLLGMWTVLLILSFALLQWSAGPNIVTPGGASGFWIDLYMSGTTFFTLGLGDAVPMSGLARFITVIEGGTGFAILALVIGYLPVLYQAFSRREVNISQLDARAGSPPTAVELLRRACRQDAGMLVEFLKDWERWSAELMESHLSYPQLAFFRSQHENQSWLAALTMVLDACALVQVGIDGVPTSQAALTFAMARHAAVDLSQAFFASPASAKTERLPADALPRLRAALIAASVPLREGSEADQRLLALCAMYEPYIVALSQRMALDLPPMLPPARIIDDWQTSVWEHEAAPRQRLRGV
jgi:hypothetical protein